MSNKQHAATLEETTSDAVHIEADKIMEIEGIGFPQSTGEMISSQANNKHQCYICGRVFKTEVAGFHNDDNAEATCSDCNFKAKTQGKLHEHLSNSMHKPRTASKKTKTYEKCYNCDVRVNGYVELMSHKKEVRPSNEKCRNLERGTCRLGNRCWYVHDKEAMTTDETKEHKPVNFKCNICGDLSKTRDEMKKHK